jgi:hypothetical protein
MAEHSKVAGAAKQNFTQIMLNALVGSPKKQAFSAFLLAIIGFLIYMKNKKSTTDNIKIKEQPNKKAKGGKGQVDAIFFKRIKELVKIVIPTWKCQ